jgi:hypothetical protein
MTTDCPCALLLLPAVRETPGPPLAGNKQSESIDRALKWEYRRAQFLNLPQEYALEELVTHDSQ